MNFAAFGLILGEKCFLVRIMKTEMEVRGENLEKEIEDWETYHTKIIDDRRKVKGKKI